jgi:hypothetical protein
MRAILFFSFSLIISANIFAQCKTFRLASNGDTLNCVDMKNEKQGKWIIHQDELRGNPGFDWEGTYKNNLKEGAWRQYNLQGDLLAMENYKWGNKDGVQRYFYMGSLEHEERWIAIDPKRKYDTVEVPDLDNPNNSTFKAIKIETYSFRDGVWKYYMPGAGSLIKTETYERDSLVVPKLDMVKKTNNPSDTTQPAKPKPKEVLDFEKKNSGKKKVAIRDGKTGG